MLWWDGQCQKCLILLIKLFLLVLCLIIFSGVISYIPSVFNKNAAFFVAHFVFFLVMTYKVYSWTLRPSHNSLYLTCGAQGRNMWWCDLWWQKNLGFWWLPQAYLVFTAQVASIFRFSLPSKWLPSSKEGFHVYIYIFIIYIYYNIYYYIYIYVYVWDDVEYLTTNPHST